METRHFIRKPAILILGQILIRLVPLTLNFATKERKERKKRHEFHELEQRNSSDSAISKLDLYRKQGTLSGSIRESVMAGEARPMQIYVSDLRFRFTFQIYVSGNTCSTYGI